MRAELPELGQKQGQGPVRAGLLGRDQKPAPAELLVLDQKQVLAGRPELGLRMGQAQAEQPRRDQRPGLVEPLALGLRLGQALAGRLDIALVRGLSLERLDMAPGWAR